LYLSPFPLPMMQFHWPGFDSLERLSAEETAELAARIAELTKAGLPLGEGLRALAGDIPRRRLRRALGTLADRLDAGMDLAEALDAQKGCAPHCTPHAPREGTDGSTPHAPREEASVTRSVTSTIVPLHLRGLVLAGLRSGRLAEVLEEYVDLQRSQADMRRRVALSLIYPFVLLAMLTMLAVVVRVYLIEQFARLYGDFGTKLPPLTTYFIRSSWSTTWGLVFLTGAFVAIPILLAAAPGARWLWPLLRRVPMIGPLLRWSHLAQFSRLMGLLLEQQVPLPDALRLTSDGLRDPDLAYGCRRVADDVDGGRVLYESMAAQRQFPPSLIPVVEWGQRAPALADAFRAAAEMFEGRLRSQGSLLEAILLPIMFMFIICFVGALVVALFLPLISLVTRLSG
jgi:type II secretory pathway component PulF